MGNKKRNPVARSKHPPSPSAAAAVEEAESTPNPIGNDNNGVTLNGDEVSNSVNSPQSKEEMDGAGYAAIKQECERALTSLRRGNHTKALRLMKEALCRNGGEKRLPPYSAALIHRVQGTVCVKAASVMDDQNAKQRYLKTAVDSARRAAEMSPNSVEFAHFYANLVYETGSEGKDYEEVMRECDRALEIENPVDPGKESLQDEKELKIGSPEGRIAHVQGELRNLKQKASISSISTWMKNLGTGDEIRLIPIRRAAEDPMELRLVQTARRPNEIKKATKTLEERRKEIEVRVAAARLMQQQQQKAEGGSNEGERSEKGAGGEVASGEKRGERRKYGGNRRNVSNVERKDRVRAFWDSMSLGMKKELLRIKVSDLKGYFGSSKDGLASELLNEALGFAEDNKTWRLWACCKCGEKFVDPESHVQHVVQEHVGSVMPKMQSVMPQGLDDDWIEMIMNCAWKPLDVSSAVKMLGSSRGKCQDSGLVDDFCSGDHNDDCDDCFKDAWDSSSEKETFRGDHDECIEGNGDIDRVSSGECRECDENQPHVLYPIDSWPISEDLERGKLLERIHGLLEALIGQKCLVKSHLNKVIQFTVEELQTLASGSLLLSHGVDQTPICICFLGAPQLRKVVKFLQELSNACSLGRFSDKNAVLIDASSGKQLDEIREKVVLNSDVSCLYLDEHLLPLDSTSRTIDDAGMITSVVGNGNGIAANTDTLLSWIFAGPSSGDQLQSWMRTKEEKMQQGNEIVQVLDKEFYNLQNLCEKKCDHLNYEETLQAVEDLCLDEGKKRENGHGGYDALLRKRKDELENDPPFMSNKTESDVISNILRDAGDLGVNQFGYEETCGGMSSQLCDLESGEDDVWRTKESWHQADPCIEVAIQRQKEQLSVEISKDDARIMRSVTEMHQLEVKLDPVSANDYRLILVPLVKSYMRAHLEDLAEKDATEKSDAAREAFLAELALDSKKGVRGGNDNLRSLQEKAKDKKKHKESRRAKDSKAHTANEHHLAGDEPDEQASPYDAPDNGHLEADNLLSVNGDALKLQEEEFRRKVELEAEERKLEETLEYQRRIENEAKMKHLAEQQHKKSSMLLPQNVYGESQDVFFDSSAHEVQEPLEQVLKNGLVNLPEVSHVASENGAAVRNSVSGAELLNGTPSEKENQGLPNGGITENGHLSSDRRSGRRSRKQKSSARPFDGKNQLPAKENIEFDSVNHSTGESISKTLGELKSEEDDEERFQADLKKAVRQSLDTFQAQQRMPLVPNSQSAQKNSQEVGNIGILRNDIPTDNVDGSDVYGTGLKNDIGEYNCFLNVIIQSLWHLRQFRDEFLKGSTTEHIHIGDPCVVCALYDIFTALSIASTDTRRDAVAPTSLRMALSNLYPDSNFFQEAQMNDASEVLAVMFDCLHKAFTSGSSVSDSELVESNCMGSWDCTNNACTVHSLFGMDIFERMNCYSCGLESRHMKYTSFFHNINANALRTMKVMCAESAFDELLNLVEMNHQLACDTDSGGCGKPNYIHHILSGPPHVFTTVLGWQNTCESAEDIASTLAALSTEIDISVLYRGLDPKHKYKLVSVVCYYGQHYYCFAFSHEHEQWFMYDDKTVKVIGSWTDVLTMCEKGHLQPQVLFFEAVK